MKETLLQKAKAVDLHVWSKNHGPYLVEPLKSERIELSLAWLEKEITFKQARIALEDSMGSSTLYVHLALGLKDAYAAGRIKISEKP